MAEVDAAVFLYPDRGDQPGVRPQLTDVERVIAVGAGNDGQLRSSIADLDRCDRGPVGVSARPSVTIGPAVGAHATSSPPRPAPR